jgi:hypothetical protein
MRMLSEKLHSEFGVTGSFDAPYHLQNPERGRKRHEASVMQTEPRRKIPSPLAALPKKYLVTEFV